jgi:ferrous iron transport protein A
MPSVTAKFPRDRKMLGAPNICDQARLARTEMDLAQLRPGQTSRVIRVQGDDELAFRILEMGLVQGVKVQYLRAAPWGDPIEVDVEGLLLSLRRREAEAVTVEGQIE